MIALKKRRLKSGRGIAIISDPIKIISNNHHLIDAVIDIIEVMMARQDIPPSSNKRGIEIC